MRRSWATAVAVFLLRFLLPAALTLAPVLAWQGLRVRASVPRLPEATEPEGVVPGPEGVVVHLAVLGESTAAGVGVQRHADGFAGHLAASVAEHTGHQVRWRAVARSGASARFARRELVPRLGATTWTPNVVVVVLGINDLLRMRRPRVFQRDMRRLVQAITDEIGPVPVVLSGIPPMRRLRILPQPLRSFVALRARAIDHAIRLVAARTAGVRYVPFDAAAVPPGSDELYFAADRFHPSSAGYRSWAAAVAAEVGPLLGDPRTDWSRYASANTAISIPPPTPLVRVREYARENAGEHADLQTGPYGLLPAHRFELLQDHRREGV